MKVVRSLCLISLPFLAACGGGLCGEFVNPDDPEDRVELAGCEARVAALRGKPLSAWHTPISQSSGRGKSLQQPEASLRDVEMVDVHVTTANEGRTLRLFADGRGSRVLRVDRDDDGLLTGDRRRYVRR